jgi:DNA segregation ATPase FtsK/SpoIIIE, S-DNA-T family
MQTRRTRFLPKALAVELRRLPWRVLGLSLFVIAAACWLALMSWSFADPSPNYATVSQPQNLLGHRGASVADSLMQGFGLAAPFLVLPLAALGFQIAAGSSLVPPRLRLSFWLLAILAVPAFFAAFPTPSRWVLNTGLGGIVGDFVAAGAAHLTLVIPPLILWTGFALLFSVLSIWGLARACGLRAGDLFAAFYLEDADETGGTSFEEPFNQSAGVRTGNKTTSWTSRFSHPSRALVATGKQPRRFWMTAARTGPSLPSAAGRARSRDLANSAGLSETTPSPFANWGSRSASTGSEDIAPFQTSTQREHESGETLFDDLRIEPFFGPRRSTHPQGSDNGEDRQRSDAPASSFRRLTGKAAEAAGGGARRILETAANSVRARKRLLFVGASPNSTALNGDGQLDLYDAALPPVSLLAPPPRTSSRPSASDPNLLQRAGALMGMLGDFGVKGKISGIYPGPVITLFELEPARGTKSSRVVSLADDIARSMSAVSARVAVVPGRDAIGIELPNVRREIVSLRAIIEAPAFQNSSAALPLALGKSIGGEPIVADLARMPHLLIAGTTGSGKSVGINTMILSLLYRLPPGQCNFIMIDPKMLELSAYSGIPHLIAPVVTDPKKAVRALKWTVNEMNARYERMSKLGVRNIGSYNAKAATAQLRGQPLRRTVQTGFDPRTDEPIEEEELFEPVSMPYIVVVIDEMADLMMVAGKEIESAVQRLSQMARAAGIHLIMATQRPSVDVVTGTIKANFPSRISFQVSSKIDSRTIIGDQGAEQLLGAGDMLYMAAGGRIVRAHGPFVSDEEVEAVVSHLKTKGFPSYRDDILEDNRGFDGDAFQKADGDRRRDLYAHAVEIVLKDRKPTTDYLQRRLGIGYDHAAAFIARMEQEGILGAAGRTGRREIFFDAGR